ncbi:hypothetical protein ACXYTJ_08160 [Gilvimarinus sp. F26214L]|uniref:hypothetical protein n=1 Tax=Gilvimarinus sp. DZF01 TaxID=3461371 RepID=UPI0040456DBB
MHHLQALCLLTISAVLSAPLYAQVSVPHEFAAGDKAVAAEVNANFQALAGALASALTRIEELETELAIVKTSNAQALDEFVEVIPDPYVPGGTTVRFVGVNVQVVSGSGATDGEVNGLGNLIVGYNEKTTDWVKPATCSLGEFHGDQAACELNGGTWAEHHKSGSHNLVVGSEHRYSRYGGLVAGFSNALTGISATVTSGSNNFAAGEHSSISGGGGNFASGESSSITGGYTNTATNSASVVVGGRSNDADGYTSVVLGGKDNVAGALSSTVLGGLENEASQNYSISPE